MKLHLKTIAFTAFLMGAGFSLPASAQTEKQIEHKYMSDRIRCDSMKGDDKHNCTGAAQDKKQAAENAAAMPPQSAQKKYTETVTKTNADYLVWMAECAPKVGVEKKDCVKAAQAGKAYEKERAKADLKKANMDDRARLSRY